MKRLLILPVILALGVALASNAAAAPSGGTKTVKGKLVCIGCALKMESGANVMCGAYGHKHGFKTKDGRIYSFIENDKTAKLITDMKNLNAKIEVTGKFFHNANFIDVESYEILEK